MKEHLTVDSVMTADGEVVPLGPVDKDGHRVPLDTTDLYGPRGEHYKVKSFAHFPRMDGWFMECAFTHDLIDVSSLRLKAPDSWGLPCRLDSYSIRQVPERSEYRSSR